MEAKSRSLSLEGFTFEESWEEKKKRAEKIVEILMKTHPREKLLIGDPYRTLVHCIISQRMRDEVTYRVWEELFKKYKDIETIANTPVEEMQEFLRKQGVGLWKTKGEWIVKASKIILERYGGKVPDDIHELMKLPGIGRKCANIVLAYGFGKQAIPVDTHVNRISKRLGLAPPRVAPEKVEEYLTALIPKEKWIYVNHAMVDHGRSICRPINPKCEECPLREFCPYAKGLVTDEDIKGNARKPTRR
ncbi:endonuclease III [Thermococcus kodakarensis KOD1]|uniref:Endonuclease III n=1 Tax=Thermococcus kodakarensis (strain ATCC BAA-918 / JCM 12380 / KOD1) TaxID=69014 RepID=Q5JE74_THEKO|nr:endonuclease III [Thermococcus kodakarensis]WCN29090.1 endonuclease III [Thermococcus kodakarensis]WCN31394.1 endonuclease III [Thermococcus kodakarensis]BAD85330.1 endonuclease III [Thermococcus kodakarensis KOD1]